MTWSRRGTRVASKRILAKAGYEERGGRNSSSFKTQKCLKNYIFHIETSSFMYFGVLVFLFFLGGGGRLFCFVLISSVPESRKKYKRSHLTECLQRDMCSVSPCHGTTTTVVNWEEQKVQKNNQKRYLTPLLGFFIP